MQTVFKAFFWMAGSFLGLVALALLLGLLLPKDHRVSRSLLLKAAPEKVWALVTQHEQDPRWRSDLKATTRLADRQGLPVWEDTFANGQRIAYVTTEKVEGQRLVRTILDQTLFGGTWTYELRAEGSGTRLTLTENGWVSVPFRAVARFVFGHATTLETYLKDVARHFGEAAQPAPA